MYIYYVINFNYELWSILIMFNLFEKIYLLSVDRKKHSSYFEEVSFNYTLVASVLCELSLLKKIDVGLDCLYLLDDSPTSDKVIDFVLKRISEADKVMSVFHWIEFLLPDASRIDYLVLIRLIQKGILKKIDKKFLWIFSTRHYDITNKNKISVFIKEIKTVVCDKEHIPDPKEVAFISLLYASNLIDLIFSPKEIRKTGERIKNISRLDLIAGKAVEINKSREFSSTLNYNHMQYDLYKLGLYKKSTK